MTHHKDCQHILFSLWDLSCHLYPSRDHCYGFMLGWSKKSLTLVLSLLVTSFVTSVTHFLSRIPASWFQRTFLSENVVFYVNFEGCVRQFAAVDIHHESLGFSTFHSFGKTRQQAVFSVRVRISSGFLRPSTAFPSFMSSLPILAGEHLAGF